MGSPSSKQKAPASPARLRSWLVSGAFVLGAGAIAWFGTSSQREHATPVAAPLTTASPAAAAASPTAKPSGPAGGLPTRVVVRSAGIDTAISEVGVVLDQSGRPAWETAWRTAGHHMDSALPGEPGNLVLTGHVSVADRGNAAVFRTLDRAKVGDVVEVYSGSEVFRYQITDVAVVEPYFTRALASDHRARLTMITCTPDLQRRLVVNGTLLS